MTGGRRGLSPDGRKRWEQFAPYFDLPWLRPILISPLGGRKLPHHAAHAAIRGDSAWTLLQQEWEPGDRPWQSEPHRTVTFDQARTSGVLTPDEIYEALKQFPDTFLGAITGAYDGDATALLVVDVDTPVEFPRDAADALKDTPTVKTGRDDGDGRHFYGEGPAGTAGSASPDWGELKSTGNYAVLPPYTDGREWIVPFDAPRVWLPNSLLVRTTNEVRASGSSVRASGQALRPSDGNSNSPTLTRNQELPAKTQKTDGSAVDLERALTDLALILGRGGFRVTTEGEVIVRCPLHESQMGGAAVVLPGNSGTGLVYCRKCQISMPMGTLYALVQGQRAVLLKKNEDGKVLRKRLRCVGKPSAALWATRLDAETGRISLPKVDVPIPSGSRNLRSVAEGFLLLLRCRLHTRKEGDSLGAPFSPSLGGPWCRMPERTFLDQRRHLKDGGWLRLVGTETPRDEEGNERGRETALWLPREFRLEDTHD